MGWGVASRGVWESPVVLFADLPLSSPLAEMGTPPTMFEILLAVNPGDSYLFEFLGDGIAAVVTTAGFAGTAMFLCSSAAEGNCLWREFGRDLGGLSMRMDIVYASVPEPGTLGLLGPGLLGLFMRRKEACLSA